MTTDFPIVSSEEEPHDYLAAFTNMSPMVDAFPASSYGFNPHTSMPAFSFDSEDQQSALADPSVMWGGMPQLSLGQPALQKWPGSDAQLQNKLFREPTNHISQFGQITPPNDTTPTADPELGSGDRAKNGDVQEDNQPKTTKGNNRSKRSSTSKRKSVSDEQDATAAPKKSSKSTRKARKGYKATTKEEEQDSEGEVKRERFLERNRVAASKCRERKKEWTSGLEGQARDLAAQNASLHNYALQLREEMLHLKGECLKHTDCNCVRIREYLDRSIAAMNPSGALHNMPHSGYAGYRKSSNDTAYTFNSGTSATDSRRPSLALESDLGGGDGMTRIDDEDMKAMLEASIATPPSVTSPQSTGAFE